MPAAWTAIGARSPSAVTNATTIVSHRFTEILLSLGLLPIRLFPPRELRLRRGLPPPSAYAPSPPDRCGRFPFFPRETISPFVFQVSPLLSPRCLPPCGSA